MPRLNAELCKIARKIVTDAVTSSLKDIGLNVRMGTISYDPFAGTARATLNFEVIRTEEEELVRRIGEWNAVCDLYGLTPEHYGKEVTIRNKTYKAIGFRPRGKKRLEVQCLTDGKKYWASPSIIGGHGAR